MNGPSHGCLNSYASPRWSLDFPCMIIVIAISASQGIFWAFPLVFTAPTRPSVFDVADWESMRCSSWFHPHHYPETSSWICPAGTEICSRVSGFWAGAFSEGSTGADWGSFTNPRACILYHLDLKGAGTVWDGALLIWTGFFLGSVKESAFQRKWDFWPSQGCWGPWPVPFGRS